MNRQNGRQTRDQNQLLVDSQGIQLVRHSQESRCSTNESNATRTPFSQRPTAHLPIDKRCFKSARLNRSLCYLKGMYQVVPCDLSLTNVMKGVVRWGPFT